MYFFLFYILSWNALHIVQYLGMHLLNVVFQKIFYFRSIIHVKCRNANKTDDALLIFSVHLLLHHILRNLSDIWAYNLLIIEEVKL